MCGNIHNSSLFLNEFFDTVKISIIVGAQIKCVKYSYIKIEHSFPTSGFSTILFLEVTCMVLSKAHSCTFHFTC